MEGTSTGNKRRPGRPPMTAEQRAAKNATPLYRNRKSDFIQRPDVVKLAVEELKPGRLLSRPEVIARTGISTSAIYSRMKAGTFPVPIPISKNAVRWRSEHVASWIADPLAWPSRAMNETGIRPAA